MVGNILTERDYRYSHSPLLLAVYLFYRFILAALFYLIYKFGLAPNILGIHSARLYEWTSILYCLICFGSLFVFRPRLLIHSLNRISLLLIIDLLVIILIIHASGGPGGSLDYLLILCVATASIFIRGQMSLSFAAMTTFFVFAEAIYFSKTNGQLSRAAFSAGVLGILVFSTAIIFHYLTEKIRASEKEAARQTKQVKHLQQMAENIITRMRTGIIVIDSEEKIDLVNNSALQLLDLSAESDYLGKPLEQLSNLGDVIQKWKHNPSVGIPWHHQLRAGQEIRLNFAALNEGEQNRTIIFLEDYRALAQQAQQLKLASLGRLTASIAHEIRNPLGAIAHAAQLLSESEEIARADLRLTEIILHHSNRVNQIVENTLVLSRRKEPKPEVLELEKFLPGFIENFKAAEDCEISLEFASTGVFVKIDPIHFSQILTNLCENGIRYSKIATDIAHVRITAGVSANDDIPYIEVVDDGPGIEDDALNQIFDPFYTTDDKGTGLGLYISRELCEINQATLFFVRTLQGKSCFRVNLSHHQRTI